jgi:hypothetical protein
MAATNNNKISYFNTLIFTIIAGVVSLGVVSLLFFDFGKQIIYFIVAFEVGVLGIIAYCIYKIIKGEMDKNNKKDKYVVRFDQCPDYYSSKIINNKEYCVADYIVRNDKGDVTVMRIFPEKDARGSISAPASINLDYANQTGTDYKYKFELRQLEQDPKIPTFEEKCKYLYTQPPPNPKYNAYRHFTQIPWTYAKSRCASLAEH